MPVLIGVLYDYPQDNSFFEDALRLGIATVQHRLDREVELVVHQARGLPAGSAHEITRGFRELDQAGCVAIIGPSISDNGIVVRDLADHAGLPCINYTGGAITRSEFMFHYQVGSLEEEPAVLAEHLAGRGIQRVAVVHDRSPVGSQYAHWFELARATVGIEVTANAVINPLETEATDLVARLEASKPDGLLYLGLGVAARTVSLAVQALEWNVPVVANSALMFGYAQREWREAWDGWVYIDTVSDDNASRRALSERDRASAAGPVGVAAYDIGRLLGEATIRGDHLTRDGIRDGLERVKRLPASSGHEGTTMGFGQWDRGALKGSYLVLREWRDGKTVQHGA